MAHSVDPDSLDRQRPFKIFLALLDKWEIGSLVTEQLVLVVIRSLQLCLPSDENANEARKIITPFKYPST